MRSKLFDKQVVLRMESTLHTAMTDIARAECTTVNEFVRREMRAAVARALVAHALKEGFALRVSEAADLTLFEVALSDGMPWHGFTVTLHGKPVGLGIVFWDGEGRAWCAIYQNGPIPPGILGKAINTMFADLHRVGEPALHTMCDDTIPSQRQILLNLGFEVRRDVVPDKDVWVLSPIVSPEREGMAA